MSVNRSRNPWPRCGLAAGLLGALFAASGDAQSPATKAAPGQPAFADADERPQTYLVPLTVRGRALDPEGRPIAGAQVFLASQSPGYKRIAETTTDKAGQYLFFDVPLPVAKPVGNLGNDSGTFEVFGWADGYALAWRPHKRYLPMPRQPVNDADEYDPPTVFLPEDVIELDLRFVKPVKIQGRITDDAGEPIPNATVAWRYADVEWNAENYNSYRFKGALHSLNEPEIVPPGIKLRTTDADGRFRFEHLPPDHRLRFDVRTPDGASRFVTAVTHPGITGDRHGNRVYSGDINLVFRHRHDVAFRVLLGDTDSPAEDVRVGVDHKDGSSAGITDAAGRTVVRVPAGKLNVELLPKIHTPYLVTDLSVEAPESPDEPVVLRLRPAAVVTIMVVDDETGKPLPDVDLWVGTRQPDSPSLSRQLHLFRSYERETRICHVHRSRTDESGRMTAYFEPGRHRIGVGLNAPRGYSAVNHLGWEADCPAGQTVVLVFRMRKSNNHVGF
jgi:protocatechuate 3,4-dioxygenase beta subunit